MDSLKYVCFLILIITGFTAFSQGENNIWYFGANAGLDFNTIPPQALSDGQTFTTEGTASVSDADGNLLFYTDGTQVWNRDHSIMLNGTGLDGHRSCTQSVIIVPKPFSTNFYYIFTLDADERDGREGLNFSEIDMSLDGGLGGVTAVKNVQLIQPTNEELTAVRHQNCRDIWVIAHKRFSDSLYAYLVTPDGVDTTPVISRTHTNSGIVGSLKVSPNGKHLVIGFPGGPSPFAFAELYEFDNSTGKISNPLVLNARSYGLEFSPSSRFLYMRGLEYNAFRIFQYDLEAMDIVLSGTAITDTVFGSAIQLGPDGKIYIGSSSFLHVINDPDSLGLKSNFEENKIALSAGTNVFLGLPQRIVSGIDPTISPVGPFCEEDTTINLVAVDSGGVWSGKGIIDSLSGIFNPLSAGGGIHEIIYAFSDGCSDTILITVNTSPVVDLSVTPITCNGLCNGELMINLVGGVPPYNYAWSTGDTTITIDGLCVGNFNVLVTDSLGCLDSDTVTLTEPDVLLVDAGDDVTLCVDSTTISAIANGGTTDYRYMWNNDLGVGQSQHINSLIGTTVYRVTAIDDNNCIATDSVIVTVNPIPKVNFSVDTTSLCLSPERAFVFTNETDTTLGFSDVIEWNFGDGSPIVNGEEVSHRYTEAGVFDVALRVIFPDSVGGCEGDTIKEDLITVHDNPVAAFEVLTNPITTIDSEVIFNDESMSLSSSAIVSWLWNFDDLGTSTERDPSFTFPEEVGEYGVSLEVTDVNGCTDTIIKTIIIEEVVTLYVPSAFTPDGDGVNDDFRPIGVRGLDDADYEFLIFNRFGELIFKSDDWEESWDGKSKNGEFFQSGVYVWKVNDKAGKITLIR